LSSTLEFSATFEFYFYKLAAQVVGNIKVLEGRHGIVKSFIIRQI